MIGCGPIAQMQIKTVLEQYAQVKIHLFDVNPEAAEKLKALFLSEYPHLEIEIHDSAKSAIQQADVLITCTVSDKPYIPFEWLKKAALFQIFQLWISSLKSS